MFLHLLKSQLLLVLSFRRVQLVHLGLPGGQGLELEKSEIENDNRILKYFFLLLKTN